MGVEGEADASKQAEVSKRTEKATQGADAAPKKRRLRRTKKARELDAARKELPTGWSFFKAHPPNAPVSVVVSSPRIGKTAGDGAEVGTAIVRWAKLLASLGAETDLGGVVFGNSVTIEFRARQPEIVRAEKELAAAEDAALDLADGDRVRAAELLGLGSEERRQAVAENFAASDLADNKEALDEVEAHIEVIETSLQSAVTDVQVAAAAAASLISVPATMAPQAAAAYGNDVADAYKTLANAVSHFGLSLNIETLQDGKTVKLDEKKALSVASELNTSKKPKVVDVVAFGVLSQADQDVHGFGLRLSSDGKKPSELGATRVVRGSYQRKAGEAIRDRGLWGKEVRATIRVTRDPLISTSTIRPPTFELVDVAARY